MKALSARIAPEVDRLVLGINRAVGPRHGRVLMAVAGELGLDSLKLIPHFADFWMDGPLDVEVAVSRLPYAPSGSVLERLADLRALGLLSESSAGFEPTPKFRPLLAASVAARGDVVLRTWADAEATMSELEPLMLRVIDAATDAHVVASAHRALTPASDAAPRCFDRLVTIRLIRHQDHVDAWTASDLTAPEMSVLTSHWHGETVAEDAPGRLAPAERGLVTDGGLTEAGRQVREQIEDDTNELNSRVFSVLDESEGERFLELLERLPTPVEP